MPPITNPLVVHWAQEFGRQGCDVWATLYNVAKVAGAIWQTQGLDALCPNTSDLIVDGSEVDGRGPITGAQLRSMKALFDAFIADADAGSNAKRNAIWAAAVNPRG